MVVILLMVPLMAAGLFVLPIHKKILYGINIMTCSIMLILGFIVAKEVVFSGRADTYYLGDIFFVDALSMLILGIVLIVFFITAIYSMGYMEEELRQKKVDYKKMKIYFALLYLFVFTIILALTARNLGLMWIAVEATTLSSVFLVGFYNDKRAVEAAWKYVMICSVGIAIALLGIVFLHISAVGLVDASKIQLDYLAFINRAELLNISTLKLAFIFCLLGFGTKVGLAPMHTWLPDAHSQAPSPISALLSGVLLNISMYCILRVSSILNRSMGNGAYTGRLLLIFGFISIFVAAIFILTQKDYKRLLAYSSIEHMGIIAVAIGIFSPAAVLAGMMHMFNHAMTKSLLFLSSGNVMLKYHTKDMSKVTGLLKIMPLTGFTFLIGIFAITGMPPFSIFSSEIGIAISAFEQKYFVLATIFILLLTVIFAGFAKNMLRMFWGEGQGGLITVGEPNLIGAIVVIILLIIIAVTGLYMPPVLLDLMKKASSIVMGR